MSADESPLMETGTLSDAKRRFLSRRDCKRILFVTNTNEYGGAEKHLLELIRRLRGPGVQVCILCLDQDFFSERLSGDHDVEVFTCKKTPRSLLDWVRLFRALKPDAVVLIYNWLWCLPSIVSVACWLSGIRKRLAVQHLIVPRPELPPIIPELWEHRRSIRGRVKRLLGRESPSVRKMLSEQPLCVLASLGGPRNLRVSAYFCNTTICVSNALRNALVKDFGFPARKLRTVHNGVCLSEFSPAETNGTRIRAKLGIRSDEFLFVCASRLSEQKGIDILLQAMARAVGNGIRCKCVIVGDGPLRDQLIEQARALGLSGHAFFEGFQKDVRPYLQASSAFILTSHWEGLPLSILEAMASGLPCLVTDVGGNTEAVTHQIHGLVVPSGSVDAVADAISYLATHPHERTEMSLAARSRACEAFDLDVKMKEIRRLILG